MNTTSNVRIQQKWNCMNCDRYKGDTSQCFFSKRKPRTISDPDVCVCGQWKNEKLMVDMFRRDENFQHCGSYMRTERDDKNDTGRDG